MAMTIGTGLGSDPRTIAAEATRLESLGYDIGSSGETQHDPFLPLMLGIEHTERMHFASMAMAFPRAPYITANIAWDLQRFSGGRFELGLGTQVKGHNERRFSVPWVAPGPRLRDYVRTVRAVWDSWQNGTKPDFESDHYQYKLTSPFFNPGPIEHPDIPIVVAAVNPFNARLAGEVCDGIAIHPFSTFQYIRDVLIPAVHEGARRAGKDPKTLHIRGGGFLATGRNEEEVAREREVVRRRISFYASTRSYVRVMATHGWDDEAAQLHRLSVQGKWDEMVGVVSDDMIEEFTVVGTWDELPSQMREKYAGINSQISFSAGTLNNPDEEEQIRDLISQLKTIPTVSEV